MSITPNMGLTAPGVGITAGPDYANQINADLTTIDSHDHTAGKGVPITTSALNINQDLTFNQYSATNLLTVQLVDAGGTLGGSYKRTLYTYNNELYYNDGLGSAVKMTNGGLVNATSSGISSGTANASFISSVLTVTQSSGVAANINVGSIYLRNNSAGSAKVTLQPPNPVGSDYILTLPRTPGQTNIMTLDSNGNMSSDTYSNVGVAIGQSGTIASDTIAASMTNNTTSNPPGFLGLTAIANNISSINVATLISRLSVAPVNTSLNNTAANTVASYMTSTGTASIAATMTASDSNVIVGKLTSASSANTVGSLMTSTGANAVISQVTRGVATGGNGTTAGQYVIATSSGAQTTYTGTIGATITNQTIKIVTSGRPVMLGVISTNQGSLGGIPGANDVNVYFRILRTNSSYSSTLALVSSYYFYAPQSVSHANIPCSAVGGVDTSVIGTPGTYYYVLQYYTGISNCSVTAEQVQLWAYEL